MPGEGRAGSAPDETPRAVLRCPTGFRASGSVSPSVSGAMLGDMNVFEGVISYPCNYRADNEKAWTNGSCPKCGVVQLGCVAYVDATGVKWLRCTSCGMGLVRNHSNVSPSTPPLKTPKGVPDAEREVWEEARACLGVGAYTGAVMLFRKVLFHMAVTQGLPAKDEKDRAPSFAECVESLQRQGVITPRMRPYVDSIKDVGNEANHEINPIEPDDALRLGKFVQHLLQTAYEMDALMAEAQAGKDPTTGGALPV